jgi:hypothetical protein
MGGWSEPANGLPFDSTGMTMCSGIHTESYPNSSARIVASVHKLALSMDKLIPIFMEPPYVGGIRGDSTIGRRSGTPAVSSEVVSFSSQSDDSDDS